MNSEDILSKLDIEDKDIPSYYKYLEIRGLGVYTDAYQCLTVLLKGKPMSYYIFSGLIRYDKQLRDIIYKYLAALEEYWKNHLFSKCEYIGDKPFRKVDKNNEKYFIILSDNSEYGWNIYRNSRLDFGDVIYLFQNLRISFPNEINPDSEFVGQIRKLRNRVMHHKMLTINQSDENPTIGSINKYRLLILDEIRALCRALPEAYRIGFLKDIEFCNKDNKKSKIKSPYLNYDEIKECIN